MQRFLTWLSRRLFSKSKASDEHLEVRLRQSDKVIKDAYDVLERYRKEQERVILALRKH